MKERTTLWDFMAQHTTLVEDLKEAAKLLGKGKNNVLSCSLEKCAAELTEYDHYLCKEYHSPFEEPDVWVLEYNEREGQFHYNSSYKDGKFRQGLFTNGWWPVCVIPDCYTTDMEFTDFLDRISKAKCSYQDAVISVCGFFANQKSI